MLTVQTPDGVKRILNCIPSRETENDWRLESAVSAQIVEKPQESPPHIDLREDWWEVGNQGNTGSCVGWATADGVLRWHFVKAKRIGEGQKAKLSVRFIWMAAKETDEFLSTPTTFLEGTGTSLKAALNIARNYGAATEEMLPFDPEVLYHGDEQEFYARTTTLKISSYINLRPYQQVLPLNEWCTWMATQGPILTRLNVDETWMRVSGDGKLDHYQLPDPNNPNGYGGHAVALVGYGEDGRLIVRNSWGDQWGHNGFAYASQEYAGAAFTEAYGVSVRTVMPHLGKG